MGRRRTIFTWLCKRWQVLIASGTLLLLSPVCSYQFLDLGDSALFAKQLPAAAGLSRLTLLAALKHVAPWDDTYGPLVPLSHMLDFQLFGSEACVHHLTNLWLHVVNITLFGSLVKRLTKLRIVAAFATVIFALHPVQITAVAWVSQRRILIVTAAVLSSNLFWLRFQDSRKPWPAVGCLLAAFMAAACLPGLGAAAIVVALVWFTFLAATRQAPHETDCQRSAWSGLCKGFLVSALLIGLLVKLVSTQIAGRIPYASGDREFGMLDIGASAAMNALSAFSCLGKAWLSVICVAQVRWATDFDNPDAVSFCSAFLALVVTGVAWKSETLVGRTALVGSGWFLLSSLACSTRAHALALWSGLTSQWAGWH